MIYAEWLDSGGNFHADIFLTWGGYYNATFCPDIDIITVRRWSYNDPVCNPILFLDF